MRSKLSIVFGSLQCDAVDPGDQPYQRKADAGHDHVSQHGGVESMFTVVVLCAEHRCGQVALMRWSERQYSLRSRDGARCKRWSPERSIFS